MWSKKEPRVEPALSQDKKETTANTTNDHYDLNTVESPKKFEIILLRKNVHDENNEQNNEHLFHIKVSANDKIWTITRTYEDFCSLDKHVHECIFDREYSKLQDIEQLKENGDNSRSQERLLAEYLNRFCKIAFATPVITCVPILNWFELDNKGNHQTDESQPINTPGVASALVKNESTIDKSPLKFDFLPFKLVKLLTNNKSVPDNAVKSNINKQPSGKVFGCDLVQHLKNTGNDVPYIVTICIDFIENHDELDGVYRVPGTQTNIKNLRIAFDEQRFDELQQEKYLNNVHSVSSLFKMYFRELPNPLFTHELYHQFFEALNASDKIAKFKHLVQKLPAQHYSTLKALMCHLDNLTKNFKKTRMDAWNLAIVWAPNLLQSPTGTESKDEAELRTKILDFIITNANTILDKKTLILK